jgi:hypothetical protein
VIGQPGDHVVEISWIANPFRGDRFEEIWRPAAEAALDYGATAQLFLRSETDRNMFVQYAAFPDKLLFERYWISEEISEARAEANGLYQLPVLPEWHEIIAAGATAPAPAP